MTFPIWSPFFFEAFGACACYCFPVVRPCIDYECSEIQAFAMYYLLRTVAALPALGTCVLTGVCAYLSVFKVLKLSRPGQNG